jgi:hypothetical protein
VNVKYLVDKAIFLSLQDPQFQPDINATYQQFALNEINNLLDEWRDKIPFSTEITFNNVTNLQSTTFVEVDTVQYVIISGGNNNAAFYLREASESEFKRLQTIIGLAAFPNVYFFDQLLQRITIYPAPTQTDYQFIVRGRVASIDLGLFDDIPANIPRFMQNAIIYEIAFRLCAQYGADWDAKKENLRNSLLASLDNKKVIDLTPDIENVFGRPGTQYRSPFPTWYYISGGGN